MTDYENYLSIFNQTPEHITHPTQILPGGYIPPGTFTSTPIPESEFLSLKSQNLLAELAPGVWAVRSH